MTIPGQQVSSPSARDRLEHMLADVNVDKRDYRRLQTQPDELIAKAFKILCTEMPWATDSYILRQLICEAVLAHGEASGSDGAKPSPYTRKLQLQVGQLTDQVQTLTERLAVLEKRK